LLTVTFKNCYCSLGHTTWERVARWTTVEGTRSRKGGGYSSSKPSRWCRTEACCL